MLRSKQARDSFTKIARPGEGVARLCAGALLVTAILAASIVMGSAGEARQDPVEDLFLRVGEVFSGERAHALVAFMDDKWRLPGNPGYDASLDAVLEILREAGYREEGAVGAGSMTWRIETRELERPAWEPVAGRLRIAGERADLLNFRTNFNLIAANSFSTVPGGVTAPLIYVGRGRDSDFEGVDVAGAVVMGDGSVGGLFRAAVVGRGALGVLSWSMPAYNRPEEHPDIIQFSSIPYDPERSAWGLRLSLNARGLLLEALARGPVSVEVEIVSRFHERPERTLIAEVRGSESPDERLVYSAHVQEPGANDNASGVATQAEMARALARLVEGGMPLPRRSITFLWGDEIAATRRYLEADQERARGVRWGISLDMVGEDTAKTGGVFLIEKMPDPSAVWTRGQDRHTEWGGRPMRTDQLVPHYLNDFLLTRFREQGSRAGWEVSSNPYEGGSDHVPFLRADIPGVLLWHFTDVFYHTDGDRLDKVSAATMANVGTAALVSGLMLASADANTALRVVRETSVAARRRLETEFTLSERAISEGEDPAEQRLIVRTWTEWYVAALGTCRDLEIGGAGEALAGAIETAQAEIRAFGEALEKRLGGH